MLEEIVEIIALMGILYAVGLAAQGLRRRINELNDRLDSIWAAIQRIENRLDQDFLTYRDED